MSLLLTVFVTFFAGMGAGLGTGFAGLSAAAVISPMLITFLHMDPYMAVGIALSSDVLASAISAYTYHKNKNLDVKNGLIMMVSVLIFTAVGSYVASLVPSQTMGSFSVFMTFLLGIKFIVRPVFIMSFTALTGAASHFMIGGMPDWPVFFLCVIFTLLWARIAAVFANKAKPATLNRATGVVLVILGIIVMGFQMLA